jgi:hypothetical protein
MPTIRKTVLRITILHDGYEGVDSVPLEHIACQINEGDWLGAVELEYERDVRADEVRAECLALGNDGDFFNLSHDGDNNT